MKNPKAGEDGLQLKKILAPALLGAAAVTASVMIFVFSGHESIKADAGHAVDAAAAVSSEAETVTTTASVSVTSATASTSVPAGTSGTAGTTKKSASSTKKTTAETSETTSAKKKTTKKTTAESSDAETKSAKKTTTTAAPAETEAVTESTAKKTTKKTSKTTTEKVTTTTAKKTSKTTTTTPPPKQEENLSEGISKIELGSGRVIINYSQQKAMWVSLFEMEELIKGRTAEQFRYNFDQLCRNCKSIGVNTLYVHARALGDAFYQSKLYPWSEYVSGTVGRSPGFDPFKIVTEVAHSYDLSVHAWINPYRLGTPAEMKATPSGYLIKEWFDHPDKYPGYVVYSETYGKYWLNPGIASVRSLITKGAKELIGGYDIDGLHIDDYFYPLTEEYFDEAEYKAYLSAGGKMSLNNWRMNNCNLTVKSLYDAVKAQSNALVFGIAPQGNYENNYNYMYADVSLWLSQPGYCDYLAPQVYFGYKNQWKPFASTLKQWASLPRDESVSLVIGIAPANMELNDEYADDVGIIARQIKDSFSYNAGAALYRYDSLFAPANGFTYRAAREVEEIAKAMK